MTFETLFQDHLKEETDKFIHIADRLTKVEETQTEILELLTQIKGAAKLLQGLFYVVGPIVACIFWLKDHVK